MRDSARQGFTLVELLIAISLMLILTLVLTQIFNSTVDIFSRSQQQVQIYSNTKGFVELLTRELANMIPASSSGQIENALRIYSPTLQTEGEATTSFKFKTGSVCRYDRSYYKWDPNYTDPPYTSRTPPAYPDEIDFAGGRVQSNPDPDSGEKDWSAPLLGFVTTTTYVVDGQRLIAPAWVEYFMAKAEVTTEGQKRTYFYLKRRLMRAQGAMVGDPTWTILGHVPLAQESTVKLPYIERPWREELYRDDTANVGSYDGDVVLEFFPRIGTVSDEFGDTADAFKIEFYVYDPVLDNGNGGYAWIRPDETFGEAVFTPSMENPLNDQATASTLRPARSMSSGGATANFYPDALRSPTVPSPGTGTVIYAMDMPLAIRVTALLGHDKTTSYEGSQPVARQDYAGDAVPPRVFQHVFWLPTAPTALRQQN